MTTGVVVFGGAGFVGSHLLKRLAKTYSGPIFSVDIRKSKSELPGVTYIIGDVRDLSQLSLDAPLSLIYNFAAVHTTPGHPTHEYYETNIVGAMEVVAFAKRHDVSNIVFTSSISVYGPSKETKSEDSKPAPESAYGWSKFIAEKVHRTWLEEDAGRRLVVARPAVVFGPGEGGNFTRLAKLLKKGVFVYPGRTDTIKSCIYVDDLVDAMLFAQEQPENYVLFNGCYPDRYTISDIIETFRAKHFSGARTFILPRSLLMTVAAFLRPMSASGLGIHPDRILKLVQSTDIMPCWLMEKGFIGRGLLPRSLERWSQQTNGRFE